jgi:hypothetical protein
MDDRLFVGRFTRAREASKTEVNRYVREFAVLYQSSFHWRNDILNKFP